MTGGSCSKALAQRRTNYYRILPLMCRRCVARPRAILKTDLSRAPAFLRTCRQISQALKPSSNSNSAEGRLSPIRAWALTSISCHPRTHGHLAAEAVSPECKVQPDSPLACNAVATWSCQPMCIYAALWTYHLRTWRGKLSR